jgi:molecular chaperone DnaK
MVLGRIVDAYLQVFAQLRVAPSAELNLPFLTATPAGPVHFQRTVTPALFAELAQRDPRAAAPKKGWWPF